MDQSLDLAVDKTMVPHVNVFVWSVYGNVTVTDTATVTVLGYCEKVCGNGCRSVTLSNKNNLVLVEIKGTHTCSPQHHLVSGIGTD